MPNHIYFYNGLSRPVLIASSIQEMKKTLKVTHSFKGDVTHEIKGIVREWLYKGATNMTHLKEALADYDLFLNPTNDDFFEKNKRIGLRDDAWDVLSFGG